MKDWKLQPFTTWNEIRRENSNCTTQVVKCAYCGRNRTANFRDYTVGEGHFRITSQHSKRAPSFFYIVCSFVSLFLSIIRFLLVFCFTFACLSSSIIVCVVVLFSFLLLQICHCTLCLFFFLLSHNNFHSYLLCCGVAFRLREAPTHLQSHLHHVLMFVSSTGVVQLCQGVRFLCRLSPNQRFFIF